MSPKGNKFTFLILALALIDVTAMAASESWESWIAGQTASESGPVVQNRTVTKADRFQVMGPGAGVIERRDFFNHYLLSAGARYHFNETHGWEIVKAHWTFANETSVAAEVRNQTSFRPDAQQSRLQLSTSYVFSPIYGKYAWGEQSLVYFDAFGLLGGGIRFANERQVFFETGLGMSHYLGANVALVPEFRFRVYSEKRSQATTVFEGLFQIGLSWLL